MAGEAFVFRPFLGGTIKVQARGSQDPGVHCQQRPRTARDCFPKQRSAARELVHERAGALQQLRVRLDLFVGQNTRMGR